MLGSVSSVRPLPMSAALLVLSTCPDQETAKKLARALIEERLAACVNQLPGLTSTYRWQGEILEESEALLLIKTTQERYEALQTRLLQLHPYDVPEVIALDIAAGHAAWLDWLREQVGG